MGILDRLTRAGRRLLGRSGGEPAPPPPAGPPDTGTASTAGAPPEEPAPSARGLSGWLEERAQRAIARAYETRAEDLEERAHRVVSAAYERSADDLEERAVRAMRRAIEAEAGRIKEAIEHGIAVKKREVRLSLLVLIVSSLVYLVLYWLTRAPAAP